ncbi:MAG: hypothetical protein CYPHOPRED_001222 [Cyphobasidiales sp. Tagirdzhanova-0007]|nr:MAG: hypothetical protein CYPHOPRED_001222 [Cyphobasidiales sp. Tagirdzhanova-0007]
MGIAAGGSFVFASYCAFLRLSLTWLLCQLAHYRLLPSDPVTVADPRYTLADTSAQQSLITYQFLQLLRRVARHFSRPSSLVLPSGQSRKASRIERHLLLKSPSYDEPDWLRDPVTARVDLPSRISPPSSSSRASEPVKRYYNISRSRGRGRRPGFFSLSLVTPHARNESVLSFASADAFTISPQGFDTICLAKDRGGSGGVQEGIRAYNNGAANRSSHASYSCSRNARFRRTEPSQSSNGSSFDDVDLEVLLTSQMADSAHRARLSRSYSKTSKASFEEGARPFRGAAPDRSGWI